MSTPTTATQASAANVNSNHTSAELLPEDIISVPDKDNSRHSHSSHHSSHSHHDGSYNYNDNDGSDIDVDCPPLRMHATRVPQRLSGSGSNSNSNSNLSIPSNLNHKVLVNSGSGSLSGTGTPRSRSRSPSMKGTANNTNTTTGTTGTDANSSISSLDDIDILTDRAGFSELDLSESQRKMHMARENLSNLPSVNERMSEDALEDVHAFSDVARSSNASRCNSIGTGTGAVLEPLSEYEDEDLDLDSGDDDLDDIQEEGGDLTEHPLHQPQVILTNMENLTLQLNQQQLEDDETGGANRGTGSSLLEESPSGPTA